MTILRHTAAKLGIHEKSNWKTHSQVVEALLDGGARVADEESIPGYDAIGDSIQGDLPHGDQVELVKLLLRYAAIQDPRKHPINRMHLLLACAKGNLELVNLMIKQNADPNPANPEELPPLPVAAKRGDLALALLFVTAGAIIDPVTDELDMCPLVCAAENGRLDMVSFLLENGEPRLVVVEKAVSTAISRGFIQVSSFIRRNSKWRMREKSNWSYNSYKDPNMLATTMLFEGMESFNSWLSERQWLSKERRRRSRKYLQIDHDSSGEDI